LPCCSACLAASRASLNLLAASRVIYGPSLRMPRVCPPPWPTDWRANRRSLARCPLPLGGIDVRLRPTLSRAMPLPRLQTGRSFFAAHSQTGAHACLGRGRRCCETII
jgi:hypothetical protein